MQNRITIENPIIYKNWNEKLLNSPDYSIFHTSNWARVLCESYSCTPYFAVIPQNNHFKFLFPLMELKGWIFRKRGICLPFSDYCLPIIGSKNLENSFAQIIDFGSQKGWKAIEIRGGDLHGEKAMPAKTFYQHILSLEADTDKLFSQLRANYRRKIRKALRNSLNLELSTTPVAMDEYYRLHCLTRKRHGLPPQPAKFFKNVYKHIISQNMGSIFLASHQKTNVAGAVFFHFGDKVLYKFGALDIRYNPLYPSYLVMWNAIKWYATHGYHEFNFGRTETNNQGLIQFKDGWGAEKQELNYFKYDLNKNTFVKEKQKVKDISYSVFDKMPLPLLKLAGILLYRYAG